MKDRRLGLLYYSLCGLIFLYVIVFQVIYGCTYLEQEVPTGVVRTTLLMPLKDYSCRGDECVANFQPATSLPYCEEYNKKKPQQTNFTRTCQFVAENDAFVAFDDSAFVATRIDTAHQTRICSEANNDNGFNCKTLFKEDGQKAFFSADIESYTMMFAHFARSANGRIALDASNAKGYLQVENENLCNYFKLGPAPCLMEPNKTAIKRPGDVQKDIITFGTLLTAANVDLDTYVGVNYLRDKGCTITVRIEYSNFDAWTGPSKPKYIYKVDMFDSGSYSTETVVYGSGETAFNDMILIDRHGVKIFIEQGGMVGTPSSLQLLMVLTTALTLLAIASLAVDKLAVYCLSNREIYYAYKYEETFDFSDAKDMTFKDALDKNKKDVESRYSGYTILAP